jgi:hypothetical protein
VQLGMQNGDLLLAFGRGSTSPTRSMSRWNSCPVIVSKRALPALDLSLLFRPWLEAI